MGSIEVFDNGSYVLITLLALLMLFIATVYVNNVKDLNKSAWFLFAALALGVVVGYMSHRFVTAEYGISLNTFVFFELTIEPFLRLCV